MTTSAGIASPVRNSDAFLAIFSDIEKWLRSAAGVDKGVPFFQVIDRAAIREAIVRRYRDDLKEFADLRNAIVHERGDGRVIAEPNERALTDIELIRRALFNPPKVVPLFSGEVKCRGDADPVGHAVVDMRAGAFSQMPILQDGAVVAVLTSETVVRWLASEVGNDLISLMETPIRDLLSHVEDEEHYRFLPRTASLHEAVAQFESFASRGKTLDAILITEAGLPNQKLLGILTIYDLPAILASLGLHRWTAA
ncbi:hypothetical protein [Variovorax sp.]|uniref:hypothetical protein n=1 Tax=Variovorax sp. TaxID=1871043 RepID=UPI003BAC7522